MMLRSKPIHLDDTCYPYLGVVSDMTKGWALTVSAISKQKARLQLLLHYVYVYSPFHLITLQHCSPIRRFWTDWNSSVVCICLGFPSPSVCNNRNSLHFSTNQKLDQKPIMTCSHALSLAWRRLHVFASSFDWLFEMSVSLICNSSFGFAKPRRKPLLLILETFTFKLPVTICIWRALWSWKWIKHNTLKHILSHFAMLSKSRGWFSLGTESES